MTLFMIWLLILIGCRLTGQIYPRLDYLAHELRQKILIHARIDLAEVTGTSLP